MACMSIEDGRLHACREDDFAVWIDLDAVLALEFVGDRPANLRYAGAGGVVDHALGERLDGCLLDVGGGVEIRPTDFHMVDLAARWPPGGWPHPRSCRMLDGGMSLTRSATQVRSAMPLFSFTYGVSSRRTLPVGGQPLECSTSVRRGATALQRQADRPAGRSRTPAAARTRGRAGAGPGRCACRG